MLDTSALTAVSTLRTERLRLEPMGLEHFHAQCSALADPEVKRLTGTHATFTEERVRIYLASLAGSAERADWAIVRSSDEQYLGEAVLNDLDADNEAMNFRIALDGEYGQGFGTEATRAVGYGFDVVGLHRISLGVLRLQPPRRPRLREERLAPRGPGPAHPAVGRRVARRDHDGNPVHRPTLSCRYADVASPP